MFTSKSWFRSQLRPYLTEIKNAMDSMGQGTSTSDHGSFSTNFTANSAGTYTVMVDGSSVTIELPAATGSGNKFSFSFINVTSQHPVRFNTINADTINGANCNGWMHTDNNVTLIDVANGKWISADILRPTTVTLQVPSVHATIQEALDAAALFHPLNSNITILVNGAPVLTSQLKYGGTCPVTIQGSSSQFYDRIWTSSDAVVGTWTGSYSADKSTAEALQGTTIDITNLPSDGLNLSDAPMVNLSRLKIVASATQNYAITARDNAQRHLKLDRILTVGSRYGIDIRNIGLLEISSSLITGVSFFGLRVMGSTLKDTDLTVISSSEGVVLDRGSTGESRSIQVKCMSHGIDARPGVTYDISYPRIEATIACIHGRDSILDLHLSSSVTKKSAFIGGAIATVWGGVFTCTSGATSLYEANIVDMPVVQANEAGKLVLGAWLSDARFPSGSNKVAQLWGGSYGRYTNPNITLDPSISGNNNNSTWN